MRLSALGSNLGPHFACSCHISFVLRNQGQFFSLLFMTLTLLRRTGQLSCKNIPSFGFVQCFNIIGLLFCIFGKIHTELASWGVWLRGYCVSMSFYPWCFDRLVKTMTTGLVILFLFVTNNHLWGGMSRLLSDPASHSTLPGRLSFRPVTTALW